MWPFCHIPVSSVQKLYTVSEIHPAFCKDVINWHQNVGKSLHLKINICFIFLLQVFKELDVKGSVFAMSEIRGKDCGWVDDNRWSKK